VGVLNGKRTKQLERRKEKMLRMKFNDRAEEKQSRMIEKNRSKAE
jgi:hypothetical protein